MTERVWRGRLLGAALWILAFLLMVLAGGYQRRTGPTYALDGTFELGGERFAYELVRSGETSAGALVAVPDPGPAVRGELRWRRYPSGEDFSSLPLERRGEKLAARLPVQPAAGKVEYQVVLRAPTEQVVLPGADAAGGDVLRGEEAADRTVVLRYKDPVPLWLLLPHVLVMFLSMMVGLRCAFAALFQPERIRPLAHVTLAGMTLGGMILGPCVQKLAFGAFWTGWPFGYDLTDNKTLIMWLAWLAAVGLIRWRPPRSAWPRIGVLAAAAVMLVVYLIPHSLRGSELDWERLEEGTAAEEAVRTG